MKPDDLDYLNLQKLIKPYEPKGRSESASYLNWFLEHIYRLDDVAADDAICDQQNDKGIDGIFVDDVNEEIVFLQARIRKKAGATIGDNRANAARSTGPKTAAGRLKSSRNAYRHGLSCGLRLDPATLAAAAVMAQALVGDLVDEDRKASAAKYARSQLELSRIRSMRSELIARIMRNPVDAKELRRLAALDRYERYCLTKQLRASRCLDGTVVDSR